MSTSTVTAIASEDKAKKRKRSSVEADELEIDVNLPEPPSKKALRRAKKGKPAAPPAPKATADEDADLLGESTEAVAATVIANEDAAARKPSRSEHGVWIGNLAFHVTPASLKAFLQEHASLKPEQMTRVHLPLSDKPLAPYMLQRTVKGEAPRARETKQNRGFAYVDFDGPEALFQVLQVSETEFEGRKVLVKDAKNFAGRPEVKKEVEGPGKDDEGGGKPRSKKVFVGNLSFEVTKDDLREHFAQAGEVEDVFLATFEDTGKCKGFGWVRFADEDMAEKAVKGWIWKEEEEEPKEDDESEEAGNSTEPVNGEAENDGEGNESETEDVEVITETPAIDQSSDPKVKKQRKRKWWINKLYGRQLRCEYAEDATTRYKKRYGKARPADDSTDTDAIGEPSEHRASRSNDGDNGPVVPRYKTAGGPRRDKPDADQRAEARRQRHKDARKVAPGKALANAPRASGAIVAGQGKKTTFE